MSTNMSTHEHECIEAMVSLHVAHDTLRMAADMEGGQPVRDFVFVVAAIMRLHPKYGRRRVEAMCETLGRSTSRTGVEWAMARVRSAKPVWLGGAR